MAKSKHKKTYSVREAISYIQNEMPVIENNADGFGYRYVTFDKLITTVIPLMRDVGMNYSFNINDGELSCELSVGDQVRVGSVNLEALATRMAKASASSEVQIALIQSLDMTDEGIRNSVIKKLFSNNNYAWDFGSSITYAKRYLLGTMLGIATAEDNDASKKRKTTNKTSDF